MTENMPLKTFLYYTSIYASLFTRPEIASFLLCEFKMSWYHSKGNERHYIHQTELVVGLELDWWDNEGKVSV